MNEERVMGVSVMVERRNGIQRLCRIPQLPIALTESASLNELAKSGTRTSHPGVVRPNSVPISKLHPDGVAAADRFTSS